MSGAPEIGRVAPDFEAIDQNGKVVSLKSLRGSPVVLYFYPKDDTPGCTKEACSFRDSMDVLKHHGVVVLGVSVDSKESHVRFASKHKLNFSLVPDPQGRIVRMYGVQGPLKTAKRVTYIIGPDGRISYVFETVNAATHAMDVLKKLEELALVK